MDKIAKLYLTGAITTGLSLGLPSEKNVEGNKNMLINILNSGNLNAAGTIVTELKDGGFKIENIMTNEERVFAGIGNFHDGYPDGATRYAKDLDGVIKICDYYHTNHVDRAMREVIFPKHNRIDFESKYGKLRDNDFYKYIYDKIKNDGKELFLDEKLLYKVVNNIRKKLETAEKNDITNYEKYIDSQVTLKEFLGIINISEIIKEEKNIMHSEELK